VRASTFGFDRGNLHIVSRSHVKGWNEIIDGKAALALLLGISKRVALGLHTAMIAKPPPHL